MLVSHLCPTLHDPWTVAHQALLSMGFPWQEYWNGLPFPSPRDLPHSGIQPGSPALKTDSILSDPPEKPIYIYIYDLFIGCAGSSLLFSSCHEWRILSCCSMQVSRRTGSSCCRALALSPWASAVADRTLSNCGPWALEHRLSSCGVQA